MVSEKIGQTPEQPLRSIFANSFDLTGAWNGETGKEHPETNTTTSSSTAVTRMLIRIAGEILPASR
jgi:hypothetical protein